MEAKNAPTNQVRQSLYVEEVIELSNTIYLWCICSECVRGRKVKIGVECMPDSQERYLVQGGQLGFHS